MTTIAEIASGDDFTVLLGAAIAIDTALPETKLVETLSSPGNLTVFAPNNAAFGALASAIGYTGDENDADSVLGFLASNLPIEVLRDVVLYHVLPTALTAEQINANPELTSALGVSITATLPTLVDQAPGLTDPTVIGADVEASNGIVHVIDQVLLPVNIEVGNDNGEFIRTTNDADLVLAKGGNDYVVTRDGDDIILAGEGRDYVRAGDGDDWVMGEDGRDRLFGGRGDDTIDGGADRDFLYGGRDDDVLNGGEGFDYLYGGSGEDELNGGDDGDHMFGSWGDDTLNGEEGDDDLYGGSGDDALSGGNGSDYLSGGWGDDMLVAGEGTDVMYGGWGKDTFVFTAGNDDNYIHDFYEHYGDKIDLSAYGFSDFSEIEETMDYGWRGTRIDLGDTTINLSWIYEGDLGADNFIL